VVFNHTPEGHSLSLLWQGVVAEEAGAREGIACKLLKKLWLGGIEKILETCERLSIERLV